MKRKLVQDMVQFLKVNFLAKSSAESLRFGLGYSGGADSKALLYLLIECRKWLQFSLHIIHVDHSWRETSGYEAKQIEREIQKLNLPFHLKTLQRPKSTKNLEERSRNERLKFFLEVKNQNNLKGIFLAHHADDAAETVLKRILEGAHLPFLSGLKPISFVETLMLIRPFLAYSKKNLLDFLKKQKHTFIEDPTNFDPSFLRACIRHNILPSLAKSFGKEVSKNLCLLAERSLQLQEYLDQKIQGFLPEPVRGPWGSFYDFSLLPLKEAMELTHLFMQLFSRENIVLPKEGLSFFVECFLKKKTDKKFLIKNVQLIWNKNHLFVLRRKLPLFEGRVELISFSPAKQRYHNWKIEIKKSDTVCQFSWVDFWQGKMFYSLDQGKYFLQSQTMADSIFMKTLRKSWQKSQIPAFLRPHLPILLKDQNERLSETKLNPSDEKRLLCLIYSPK